MTVVFRPVPKTVFVVAFGAQDRMATSRERPQRRNAGCPPGQDRAPRCPDSG
ncbi:hypothetical protein [Paenirhodobacter sp.]|uniref:hypothetical protein n=1 Tax=Paenirhodobacter sp. TaxID=1965326 RepID=UPI003B3DFE41